ncbi:MAG: methyltransferase domain-containing protein [Sedimentisphaerales bacterium]|nr:methyltransferase domain-containing protein [Sedimentisphaerales bacterium]
MTNNHKYVHGYSERENQRLVDQATTLTELLHHDTKYPSGSLVLEAGCGVGAQTITLVKNSPKANFICVDISEKSLKDAQDRIESEGFHNAKFQKADLLNLPFEDNSFDHIFICFVLEHLKNPVDVLLSLKRKLKPGGSITVIEGDHGSAYFYPDSKYARQAIQCLIDLQAEKGGDSLIGRRLYPLMCEAGFNDVSVSPRMVYVDSSKPEYVEGFTKNTFTAMVEGVGEEAIGAEMMDTIDWEKGIADLYRTAEKDGTFCYTFFKAVAIKK